MTTAKTIQQKIDELQGASLMDLALDQCTDLEALLALARREVQAAEQGNFRELMAVVKERATLGERLETYHRQIAELRTALTPAAPAIDVLAAKSAKLAAEIQLVDALALAVLQSNRERVGRTIAQLEERRRHSVAYLRDGRSNGLSCDRRA
jgi:sigma54-dependent transcription regulator